LAIDKYLEQETQGNFVRWMDDIDFGVQDIDTAKKILRGLDEILLTRGLRLNLGKTKILSAKEAKEYFLPDQNRHLTILSSRITKKLDSKLDILEEKCKVKNRFRKFLKLQRIGRWEKVYKRFFTISGKTKDNFLEAYVPELLQNSPDLRASILRYYNNLGANTKRFKHLKNFMESQHCLDDVAIFSAAKLLTDWQVSPRSIIRRMIVELAISISQVSSAHLVSSIWLLSKYGTSIELSLILDNTENIWKHSGFLCRQVAATMPRIRDVKGNFLEKTFAETGQIESLRILYNLNDIRTKIFSKPDRLYIMHNSKNSYYPLSKFLIALDILNCQDVDCLSRQTLRDELVARIQDPIYIQKIKRIQI
jgi:hypothetical protein